METWWMRNPERLEFELQALRDAGIPFAPMKDSIDQGIYQLRLTPTLNGQTVELIAVFPDLYPYFRFELIGPGLDLPHHQHPFGKALCMVGRQPTTGRASFCWPTSFGNDFPWY